MTMYATKDSKNMTYVYVRMEMNPKLMFPLTRGTR
jgi:hypothetical protein